MRKQPRVIHNIHLRFDLNDPDERRICEAIREAKNQSQYVMKCVSYYLECPPQKSLSDQMADHTRRIEMLEQGKLSGNAVFSQEKQDAIQENVGKAALEFLAAIPGCG